MRNHPYKKKIAKKARRASLTTLIIALAIPAIAAAAVVSRQTLKKGETSGFAGSLQQQQLNVADSNEQSNVVASDKEKIASGLRPLINQSTEGLVEVQHPDGTVSVNLDDRFQNVTVAKVNANGTLSQSCVDNPRAAGAFFGIDPKTIETKPVAPARTNQ